MYCLWKAKKSQEQRKKQRRRPVRVLFSLLRLGEARAPQQQPQQQQQLLPLSLPLALAVTLFAELAAEPVEILSETVQIVETPVP
mmetsp:Transcript_37740/g.74227  ORF Transcript_37740/g.74227 Transcript_37740/m.74227 type:complete len:85 (+) Transcript_37740:543-797(+)